MLVVLFRKVCKSLSSLSVILSNTARAHSSGILTPGEKICVIAALKLTHLFDFRCSFVCSHTFNLLFRRTVQMICFVGNYVLEITLAHVNFLDNLCGE